MALTLSLQGKVAVVTGGGRGIGKAITESLTTAGATVVIASRKLENLTATAEEFSKLPGTVVPMTCHVGKPDQLDALIDETEAQLGPVDILINNSATNIGQGPALETDEQMLDKMVEINVKSAFRLVHRVVPSMRDRGGGSIINVSSISGLKPQAAGLLYSFTKAGLLMLTRSWAREFGPWNIRVNALAPGLIKTDFSAYYWSDEARTKELIGEQPLKRIGEPGDIGFAAAFLASDAASFITGQTLVIDGGAMA